MRRIKFLSTHLALSMLNQRSAEFHSFPHTPTEDISYAGFVLYALNRIN